MNLDFFSFFRKISSWSLSGQKPSVFFSPPICVYSTQIIFQLETKFNNLTFYWSQGNRLFTLKTNKKIFHPTNHSLSSNTPYSFYLIMICSIFFYRFDKQCRIFTVFVIVVWFRFIIFYCLTAIKSVHSQNNATDKP